MRTAVDSSVLLTLFKSEPGWEDWSRLLREALADGPLVVCPVVFAEVATGWDSAAACGEALRDLGINYEDFTPESCWLAGQVFLRYRHEGGPREHLIPDFLVAAHARRQADRLAAIDRGYLRRYFEDLPLLTPHSSE